METIELGQLFLLTFFSGVLSARYLFSLTRGYRPVRILVRKKDRFQRLVETIPVAGVAFSALLVLRKIFAPHILPALGLGFHPPGWLTAAGIVLALLSFYPLVGGYLSLGDNWRVGIGSDHEGTLVTSGIYARTRNPVYLFFGSFTTALFLVNGDYLLLFLALLTTASLHLLVLREEEYLRRLHGRAYEAYTAAVPRYLPLATGNFRLVESESGGMIFQGEGGPAPGPPALVLLEKLRQASAYLLDLDGTIYLGDCPVPGGADFVEKLRSEGKKVVFLSNNSAGDRFGYAEKLTRLGIPAEPEDVFTSGEAAALYLKRHSPNCTVYLLGTPLLEEEFRKAGLVLTAGENPHYVVVGFDTTLTYEKLWQACDYIRGGSSYLATHPDLNCPLGKGKVKPDAGAIIAFIAAATGCEPLIVGKPYRHILDELCQKYSLDPAGLVMVGDRLYTDIELAKNCRIPGILVLSGETTLEQYVSSALRADAVFPSVAELGRALWP